MYGVSPGEELSAGNGLSLGSELGPSPGQLQEMLQSCSGRLLHVGQTFCSMHQRWGLGSASTNQGPGITGSGPIRGGSEAPATDTGDASDE